MKLTLARAKKYTARCAKEHGLRVKVIAAEWVGQLCRERMGTDKFREARVLVESNGQQVWKSVTLDTTGYVRVS